MSSRAENWTLFYTNLSSNLDVNLKMSKIMGFNQFHLPQENWILNLKENPGLSMLLVNGFHDLILLHQINFLQENIFCTDSKLLGLLGGLAKATAYRIDPTSASSDFEIPVPTWRDLKSVTSVESVSLLTVPEQNPPVFRGKNSIIIPPLVLSACLEAKTLCPATLIPILSAKFQEFDCSNTQAKACTSLRLVLEFFWMAYKKLVPPSFIAVETSNDGLDWSSRLHYATILQTQGMALPPPFLIPPPPASAVDNTCPMDSIAGDIRIIRESTYRMSITSRGPK
jgi:hypothetical protein